MADELIVVSDEKELPVLQTPEQLIELLRKENNRLNYCLEAERSLFREMADCLIEHRLRPNNPLNYVAISNVLAAYRKQNGFWRSRAQEMEEANKPHQKVFEDDIGIKILRGNAPEQRKIK